MLSQKNRPLLSAVCESLTSEEIEELQAVLLQKRNALVETLTAIATGCGPDSEDGDTDLPTASNHPADHGTDCFEHEASVRMFQSESQLLEEIEAALQRIREGTYGLCEATRRPIGVTRLRARPWARHCIEYARAKEKRARWR